MQTVYSPYEIPFTPMVPQHIMINSPQINSQFTRYQTPQNQQHQHPHPHPHPHPNQATNQGYSYEEDNDPTQKTKQYQQRIYQNYQDDDVPQFGFPQHFDQHPSQGGLGFDGTSIQGIPSELLHDNGEDDFYLDYNGQNHHLFNEYNENLIHGSTSRGGLIPNGNIEFTSAPSRTVYLGNIPNDITPKEILDHVRSGVIENFRILPEKKCAFISFLDESNALLFHSDAILKRLSIKDKDIKIGWGRNGQISPIVLSNIQKDNASRNVYIGNLPKDITEDQLINDLKNYGIIDTVKILSNKGVAFVHFCSILNAINVVENLAIENEFYDDKKIFYGKDRCAFITKTQQHNAAQYLGLAPGMEHLVTNADRDFISSTLLQQSAAAAAIATTAGGANNLGNRTVYLGNLPKDIKIEEICNVVRGGLLENVKYLQDRHVSFITFIDPIAAAQFFAMSQLHGLTIHNKRIKIGWGKHSGPLSNALTLAVSSGASRNIYIGNIDLNNKDFNKESLYLKFQEFGEIEQINYLMEKNCVFINFTNISNAILAIDKIKIDPNFKQLKINFGKDRCGNIPRQFVNKHQ
ncbi:hypothetical protein WICMUC_005490 [Wickerhamomyces mucosus]|uniref:RRM domain-containing protein n=1 Tax=Wickerhamomyces mucosus TaxID=1378264 RepID=A0A9P8P6W2_9ASCO|nr:hypothetical protein WICMUC_005490 [Wickerhamomyces mucosus]